MQTKSKIFLKSLYVGLFIVLLLLIGLTVASLTGFPKQFQSYVVETGSMTPNIPAGSLVFVTPDSAYNVGDVITFKTVIDPGQTTEYTVTHRVVEVINDEGTIKYRTQGDANNVADVLLTPADKVIGKTVFHIPYVGQIVGFAKTKLGFTVLVLIPVSIIIYSELQSMLKVIKDMWERKHNFKPRFSYRVSVV